MFDAANSKFFSEYFNNCYLKLICCSKPLNGLLRSVCIMVKRRARSEDLRLRTFGMVCMNGMGFSRLVETQVKREPMSW